MNDLPLDNEGRRDVWREIDSVLHQRSLKRSKNISMKKEKKRETEDVKGPHLIIQKKKVQG